jgi:signal transduction histidine kinase/ActR/RegA family two-component response regulator
MFTQQLKKYLYLWLITLLFLVPALAQAETPVRQTLRVGYVHEQGFFYKDARGEYRGLSASLLYNIGMHGNFDIQIIEFPNYIEEDKALADGKIDVEITVPYTEERAEQFLFSDSVTATVPLTVVVNIDNDRYEFGDMKALNKMRIGLTTNDAIADVFQEWCQRTKLTPQIIFYPDAAKVREALNKGEIDGTATNAGIFPNTRNFIYFDNVSCHAMFTKNKHDLMLSFDSALKQILAMRPLYEQELYDKFIPPEIINASTFTQSEKTFIASNKTITVAMQKYDPPFSFDNKGQLSGIIPPYYKKLSEISGLHFKFVSYDTAAEVQAAVLAGKADVMGIYSGSLLAAYKAGLRLIDLSERSIVFIAKTGNTNLKTAAVLNHDLTTMEEELQHKYDFKPFDNADECYDALKDGKVDCIICGETIATWLYNNHRLEGYSITPAGSDGKLYIAVASNNEDLYNILRKSAHAMPQNLQNIITANVLSQDNFGNFLAKMPLWALALFGLIMTIIVILLVLAVITLTHRYKEKAILAAREANNEKEAIRIASLEKTAEAKNQFFANISHDLRTPLNAIIGFSSLAEHEKNLDVLQDYLHKINSSGQLMLDLVNDTLTISKINSSKLESKTEPILADDEQLFGSVLETVKPLAAAKNITLTVNEANVVHRWVLADKLNLQKVLLNLVTNAIKYTPAGGHIKINFWEETATDGSIDDLFSVEDDGIGISPKFQSHVFEPFSQENRHGYESTGTGLGLSIVKQLVTLMGGEISLKSELNNGSTFTVRMHLANAPTPTGTTVQTKSTPTSNMQSLAGKEILLCEDNALNTEIACILLRSKGLVVTTAVNGRLGLEAFKASAPHKFAAILMDLRMPELDGFEAAKAIRALDREDAKTVPIIAMTADTFPEDINKCMDVGMNDHLSKPINPRVLFTTLLKYVK